MIELVLALGTGLVAGAMHVVSGPDHMAALLPFAVDAPKRSVRFGLLWGVGHGMGVVLLGALFLVLRRAAPVERISHASELIVGVLLVAAGLWALRRSRWVVVHHHGHAHEERPSHAHPHVHFNDPTVDQARHQEHGQHRAHHHSTFGFGLIHGLAGASHIAITLPALALSEVGAATYLGSYLLGGMAAMTAFGWAAGALVRRPALVPAALRVAGASAIGVGLFWVTSFALA